MRSRCTHTLRAAFPGLHFAARHGAIESADVLLSAEVNKGEPGRRPPRGQLRSIDVLTLQIDERAADGTSALVIAVRSGIRNSPSFSWRKGRIRTPMARATLRSMSPCYGGMSGWCRLC